MRHSGESDAENGLQLRSRLKRILNVAQRLRLRFSFGYGVVGNHFEHPPILITPVLKIAANFVLSSSQSSTYPPERRASRRAWGVWVKRSTPPVATRLRPRWTTILNI